MVLNWKDLATKAAQNTDEEFKKKISGLTRLNDQEIEELISESGIDKENFISILKEIKDASKSNEEKAKVIMAIEKGTDLIIGIVSKLI